MTRIEGTQGYLDRARGLGVEFERRPSERVVITGYAQLTPLGGTEETWQGLLEGRSGARRLDIGNHRVSVAAPVEFNPENYFTTKELKSLTPLNAMAITVSREALGHAGLLNNEGNKIDNSQVKRHRAGVWISSTIGSIAEVIEVHEAIRERGSKGISPFSSLRILPEQLPGRVAIELGLRGGWSGNSAEACATGASSIIEATRLIRDGRADVMIAGGFEEPIAHRPEVLIGSLSTLRALSANDNPEKASRPFDKDRDGFVIASGGGVLTLEGLEHALARGAPIYAEVLSFEKSTDGYTPTELDAEIVAATILFALKDERSQSFHNIDVIFAHATSTKLGDPREAQAFRLAFGEDLKEIPIAAIKSNFGHLEGGAGAVNAIAAINAINTGKIPHILNLESPDPEVADLNFVRGKPLEREVNKTLATAYGFGGFNAVLLLGKYSV